MRRAGALATGAVVGFVLVVLGYSWHARSRAVQAQAIHLDAEQSPQAHAREHVLFDAEPQTVAAGKPATVMLHFRIESGFHINSHTPRSDLLIPTKIAVEDMNGAEVSAVDFPAGSQYSFAADPGNKLDVYTGDVVLLAHVKARAGSYTLQGALHYQACDAAACYPPKTLKVEQPFTAR